MPEAKAKAAATVASGDDEDVRSAKSERRRDAILRAAIEEINTKSFALATMSEIAARLDLKDAALYYYFPTKRALAFACHRRSLHRFERHVNAAETATANGAAKLRLLIHGMLLDSEKNGPLLYFGDYSYLDQSQRRTITAIAERSRASVEQIIREGIDDGSIVDCEPQLVVQLLLGMLIWLGKWVPSVPDMTVDRLMGAIGAFNFHGLDSRSSS